jgi:hypothetical protein
MKPLIRNSQPYTKKIAHRGIWVEPALLAEIEYRAKSAEGKVRPPFLQGHPGGFMNWDWGQIFRDAAVAIGLAFVLCVAVYLLGL